MLDWMDTFDCWGRELTCNLHLYPNPYDWEVRWELAVMCPVIVTSGWYVAVWQQPAVDDDTTCGLWKKPVVPGRLPEKGRRALSLGGRPGHGENDGAEANAERVKALEDALWIALMAHERGIEDGADLSTYHPEVTITGHITAEEFMRAASVYYNDPDYDGG